MKVLLVNPHWKNKVDKKSRLINRPWPPLDLLNCASLLEQNGIKAEIIDSRAKYISIDKIKEVMKAFDLVFVTSSPIDRWQCPNTEIQDFIEFINFLGNKEKIYIMGAHGTTYPEKMLGLTKINGIIVGQPEKAILNICKNGLNDKIIGPVEIKLDEIPTPAYEKIDINNYYYELLGGKLALLETTRGCPYKCNYCFKMMYSNSICKRNLDNIKKDIDYVVEKIKAKSIYFIDLEFTLNKEKVAEIAEYILNKKYKINWCCQTRVDAVDYELLRLMKSSGCSLIHYGVESASERILSNIQKNISLDKISNTFKATKKVGIAAAAFFMFGFPGETEEEMKKTIEFSKKLNPDYVSFHQIIPYPRTAIIKDNSSFELFCSPKYDENITRLVKKAYIKFYLRPSYLISRLFKPDLLLKQIKLLYNIIK